MEKMSIYIKQVAARGPVRVERISKTTTPHQIHKKTKLAVVRSSHNDMQENNPYVERVCNPLAYIQQKRLSVTPPNSNPYIFLLSPCKSCGLQTVVWS